MNTRLRGIRNGLSTASLIAPGDLSRFERVGDRTTLCLRSTTSDRLLVLPIEHVGVAAAIADGRPTQGQLCRVALLVNGALIRKRTGPDRSLAVNDFHYALLFEDCCYTFQFLSYMITALSRTIGG
jgi:hypothetical protein